MIRILSLAGLAAALAGCYPVTLSYVERRETSFGAGDAVAANRAVHTIDPWPAAAAKTALAHDGQRIAKAVERYRRGPADTSATPSTLTIPIGPPPAP